MVQFHNHGGSLGGTTCLLDHWRMKGLSGLDLLVNNSCFCSFEFWRCSHRWIFESFSVFVSFSIEVRGLICSLLTAAVCDMLNKGSWFKTSSLHTLICNAFFKLTEKQSVTNWHTQWNKRPAVCFHTLYLKFYFWSKPLWFLKPQCK